MINQNVLDLTTCVLIVVTFSMRVSAISVTGALGYFICVMFFGETATNSIIYGSIIYLTTVATTRMFFWNKCAAWFRPKFSDCVYYSRALQDGLSAVVCFFNSRCFYASLFHFVLTCFLKVLLVSLSLEEHAVHW